MTWAKLSDSFHTNDRLLSLDHGEFRLFVTSITFAHGLLRGNPADEPGTFAEEQARALCRLQRVKPAAIKGLIAKGLWEQHPRGYRIYKFTKFLPTWRDQAADHDPDPVKQRAGRAGAAARVTATPGAEGEQPGSKAGAAGEQNVSPVPVPVPVNPVKASTVNTPRGPASSAKPPPGYVATSDPDVWVSPDGSEAWTPPPEPPGAMDEVRLKTTATAMQQVVHASFGRLRRLLTDNPGYTVSDLQAAVSHPATLAEDPKDKFAFIIAPYANGGLSILERCYRRRIEKLNGTRHAAVREDERDSAESVRDVMAQAAAGNIDPDDL